MARVYLDHHAATPLCAAAAEAMAQAAADAWANPASPHAAGRSARALLEAAREQMAAAIGAAPADVVLGSGGTEACNQGVLGLAKPHSHVITSAIEHPAVARAVDQLQRTAGIRVTHLAVPRGVPPTPEALGETICDDTSLVALQWVNHETGTILPVAEYARVCRAASVALFVDATQALGKVPVDVETLGADALALAAHKMGGPAGAGALWVRRGRELASLLAGGAQERGRRAGSPDVLAHVGFGAACSVLGERLAAQPRLAELARELTAKLVALGGVANATEGPRAATTVSVAFAGRRAEELVAALDLEGVCVAAGPACSSGLSGPSAVLLAMHPEEEWRASSSLRFSFGPETTETNTQICLKAVEIVLSRGVA